MKSIFTISFALILFIAFSSCDKIKDATTVDFDTSMSVDIPVTVEAPAAALVKSAQASGTFSESVTESLEDNNDVNDYLDYLEEIDITDIEVQFSGLQSAQIIESIELSVEGVGVIATITNVSTSNLVHHPTISQSLLDQVAGKLKSSKQITVTVSGTTNDAPMTFTVSTDFDLYIEASPL